jgi:hypothetical protein
MTRTKKQSTEAAVREIRRRTRRKFAPEEKVRIVLEGLRGEQSISELCRREGIAANLYYRWSKDFQNWVYFVIPSFAAPFSESSSASRSRMVGGDLEAQSDPLRGADRRTHNPICLACMVESTDSHLTRSRRRADRDLGSRTRCLAPSRARSGTPRWRPLPRRDVAAPSLGTLGFSGGRAPE